MVNPDSIATYHRRVATSPITLVQLGILALFVLVLAGCGDPHRTIGNVTTAPDKVTSTTVSSIDRPLGMGDRADLALDLDSTTTSADYEAAKDEASLVDSGPGMNGRSTRVGVYDSTGDGTEKVVFIRFRKDATQAQKDTAMQVFKAIPHVERIEFDVMVPMDCEVFRRLQQVPNPPALPPECK